MATRPVLSIPQPCSESWATMTPAGTGRHCAACAKTVVDFTLKTDAEILAYLAKAASGRTCGRFVVGQLERPLQPAVPTNPTTHWRAWLAAAVALWAVREVASTTAHAQASTEWRARYWGGPAPATPPAETPKVPALPAPAATLGAVTMGLPIIANPFPAHLDSLTTMPKVLRGIVTDSLTNEGAPGVTVLLTGTTIGTSTRADGSFELAVPAKLAHDATLNIAVSSIGYLSQQHRLTASTASVSQHFKLQANNIVLGGYYVIEPYVRAMPPAPWHPRRFYYWGKYWVTRPFRRW